MLRVDDHVRSFGMSGLLISEELRSLEDSLGVALGHTVTRTNSTESESVYYPQFEQSVRGEAADMAAHYEMFYCLEQSIRSTISEVLDEAEGSDWWESGRVPEAITRGVEQRVQREVERGVTVRSERLIDYTTFGELSEIIKASWDLFGAIFTNRLAVERVMGNLNLLRGPIAHCCKMSEDEVDRLKLAVKDWFRITS